MTIITISRGSFSHGKEIAERVAQELNYKCISREVLLAASEEFNIPEIALMRAIKNAPSFLQRFTHGKEKYISYIRTALLEYVMEDNIVYHGFAGHFLLEGIPNVLKVRICADIEERAGIVMEKEKVSRKQALKIIKDIDNERKKWAIDLYGKNPRDLSVYDLWLVISRLSIDDAINDILFTVRLPAFQTTPETQKIVKNLTIAARVKSNLMNYFPEADVSVEDHTVVVHIKRSLEQEEAVEEDIRSIVMELPGVEEVRVDVIPIL
jgi:cytidylate kinase